MLQEWWSEWPGGSLVLLWKGDAEPGPLGLRTLGLHAAIWPTWKTRFSSAVDVVF